MNTEGRTPGADAGRRKEAVRKATAEDVPRLARALARAFYEDPVMRWVFPDDWRRLRQLERSSVSVSLRRMCLPHGETYTTRGRRWGRRSGCRRARSGPAGSTASGYCPTWPRLGAATCPSVALARPRELQAPARAPLLHVHPGGGAEHQGRGTGTALMRPVLRTCDREGVPAYLEASAPRNRYLYARNGFEVVGETGLPGGGPAVWRMWRELGA